MQKLVDFLWVDIDVKDLGLVDYMKMFGIYALFLLVPVFMMFYITW